jgi:uncharacterized membrane-anchored protein
MITNLRALVAITAACGILTPIIRAADDSPSPPPFAENEATSEVPDPKTAAFLKVLKSIKWTTSGDGDLGGRASLAIPPGYLFTGGPGTIKMMEAYGNLTSGNELGYIAPDNLSWFAVFEFDGCGYVKDDEKDKLDADKILDQMKEGQKKANQELTKRGMPTLEVLGWHTPPFYNQETNNLEWAIRVASQGGGETINYKTKLLGRRGVMDVVLVCNAEQLATVVPEHQKLLKGYNFTKEESYASFSHGDKVAEYGLTGLIVGGGLLVAAKSGLLAKLWKPIAVGLVAIAAFFKRIFTGRTKETI